MKHVIALSVVLVLILFSSFAAGEEAGALASRDDHPIEEIVRSVMEYPWSGEMNCVKDRVDHETYTEVVLGSDCPDGTINDAATILVSKSTGRVIYYRRIDYRMPEILNEDELWGLNDDRETALAWSDLQKTWMDWGKQTFTQLTGDDPGRYFCDFLHSRDENTVLFAFCNDNHGELHAAMICALPDAEQPEPLLMAYADVETDPSVGYDGCLTKEQATDIGTKALRETFCDAADHLVLDYRSMLIYDALLYIEIDPDDFETEDAYWAFLDEKRNTCTPLWIIGMSDPRDDLPDVETGHQYWAYVHAATGELVLPPTVTEYEIGW